MIKWNTILQAILGEHPLEKELRELNLVDAPLEAPTQNLDELREVQAQKVVDELACMRARKAEKDA